MKPELKKAFEDALNVKVHVTKDDKKIMMTRLAMGFEQLAIQWAKGDRHARRDVFHYAAVLGVDLHPKQIITEALGLPIRRSWKPSWEEAAAARRPVPGRTRQGAA